MRRPRGVVPGRQFTRGQRLQHVELVAVWVSHDDPLDDRFSARRGTYRIIYRIDDKNRIVTVVDVDYRRDVYRIYGYGSLVAG
jgi:mRNA-degrading endonuclease RelE of RelBE toxin-antitoxin system